MAYVMELKMFFFFFLFFFSFLLVLFFSLLFSFFFFFSDVCNVQVFNCLCGLAGKVNDFLKAYCYLNLLCSMKKVKNGIGIIAVLVFVFSHASLAQEMLKPDSNGIKLRNFYLGLNVEKLWIGGHHVNWETGEPDDSNATHDVKTHCSAFTAAACERMNIYILRPPQHKQGLLANAQYDWLKTDEAYKAGWRPISGNDEFAVYNSAQEYADKGYVVAAVFQNPDKHKPGHAALIMPDERTIGKIKEEGPEVIQAGQHNYAGASLIVGFKNHITKWPETGIEFYYNVNRKF